MFPYELNTAQPEQVSTLIPATDQPLAIEAAVPVEPDAATDQIAAPPTIVATLPEAAAPMPPSPNLDQPVIDRPAAEEPAAAEQAPDPLPVPVETITTIDDGAVPLPRPKSALADTTAAKAKPQAASRPRAKAKKLRYAARPRARKPLPEATEFEERQGQFLNFGYGNTWDNRAGWSTQLRPGQRSENGSRPAE